MMTTGGVDDNKVEDAAEITKKPCLHTHGKSSDGEILCPICHMDYNKSQKRIPSTLNCGHMYHPECIAEWMKRKKTCPMCRCRIKSQSNPYEPVAFGFVLPFLNRNLSIRNDPPSTPATTVDESRDVVEEIETNEDGAGEELTATDIEEGEDFAHQDEQRRTTREGAVVLESIASDQLQQQRQQELLHNVFATSTMSIHQAATAMERDRLQFTLTSWGSGTSCQKSSLALSPLHLYISSTHIKLSFCIQMFM